MAVTAEFADFSGVDSRSSPLRLPPGRALRAKNWIVKPNGMLQLRYGYTSVPMQSALPSPAHSAAFVDPTSGTPYVIAGSGTSLRKVSVDGSGIVTALPSMASSNKWNGVFADGKFILGNGVDKKWFDGTTLRHMGIRAPTAAEAASVTVSYVSNGLGSWSTTAFSGHQFYMAYFNPITQECGNRIAIGARLTIGTANGQVVLNGLPNLSAVDTELV